jgi:hypothetical protein
VATVSKRTDQIKEHISDQLALERHVLDAIMRQRDDEAVRQNLEANKVVIEIERILKEHTAALDNLAEQYGSTAQSTLKRAVTEVLGVAAGIYDKMRDYKVSRMLRDDYTALSLIAMGYTAFHTFGLVIKEERIASLSLNHLKDVTPILVELSRVLPMVVAEETVKEIEAPVDSAAGRRAVENTQAAWSHTITEATHI